MLSPEELRAREISQMDSEMKKKLSGGGIKYNSMQTAYILSEKRNRPPYIIPIIQVSFYLFIDHVDMSF
jgi:hypothetical protein